MMSEKKLSDIVGSEPSYMSALQDCHDYCGTSPGSTCSCSLVNSVVYQKMMTIAGDVLVLVVMLVVMKSLVCRTTV